MYKVNSFGTELSSLEPDIVTCLQLGSRGDNSDLEASPWFLFQGIQTDAPEKELSPMEPDKNVVSASPETLFQRS